MSKRDHKQVVRRGRAKSRAHCTMRNIVLPIRSYKLSRIYKYIIIHLQIYEVMLHQFLEEYTVRIYRYVKQERICD